MLIVEGPDGAGKTRLCEHLSREFGWPIAPRAVGPDTKPLVNMAEWIDDNLTKGYQEVIFDRHRLISEPIYGPWVRGQIGEDLQDSKLLTNWLGRFDAMIHDGMVCIIYCLPPLDTVMDNLAGDEDTQNERLRMEMPGIYWQYFWDYCRRAAEFDGWILDWDYTATNAPHTYEHLLDDLVTWQNGTPCR